MDHFEFILIITSVIYALAVAQILSGISRISQSKSKVIAFLPHSIWVFNLFIFIFLIWWASWEFRNVVWTFPQYAYMLIAPTLLFYACSLLLPQQLEGEQVSMEEHFFRIRRPLFVAFFLATFTVSIDGNLLSDEEIWHTGRIGQIVILAAAVWAWVSSNRNSHRVIALVTMAAFLVLIAVRFWNPR